MFGQGSREPVAITILVRSANTDHEDCRIFYRDIGDYLKREEKLSILREAGSITGIDNWREITPDRHDDWIGQRDETFQIFYPLGSKTAKAGRSDEAIFNLFSNGYKTGRDAYIYNFSRDSCAENARKMVRDYMGALRIRDEHPTYTVDEAAQRFSASTKWDQGLKRRLARQETIEFSFTNIWSVQYRPFVKQYGYVDRRVSWSKYKQDSIFPPPVSEGGASLEEGEPVRTENRVICVPGIGANKPFSVLITDRMPDLHFLEFGQCFPRWTYPNPGKCDEAELFGTEVECVDNIPDAALLAFRERYSDDKVSKDAIFYYVYGVLHAPAYRERFANDLAKALPRIPMAPDFDGFATAGRDLAALHLGYETCAEYPLEIVATRPGDLQSHDFRLRERAMRFTDDERTVLIVNDHIHLAGIPGEAHGYVVNGRTPLDWLINRYRVKRDPDSGIVNDPNGWFSKPEDLIAAIRRIVHVSVETVRIVASLPRPFAD